MKYHLRVLYSSWVMVAHTFRASVVYRTNSRTGRDTLVSKKNSISHPIDLRDWLSHYKYNVHGLQVGKDFDLCPKTNEKTLMG